MRRALVVAAVVLLSACSSSPPQGVCALAALPMSANDIIPTSKSFVVIGSSFRS